MNFRTKYEVYGWNASAWRHVFVELKPHIQALENIGAQKLSVIEFGANRRSALTNELTELDASFEITCYNLEEVSSLRAKVIDKNMEITYRQADLLNFDGRYDLILMKSVLGGVFREDESKIDDVKALIEKIRSDHLTSGGILVSLDNGESVLESFLDSFGARKNGYRFFKMNQLGADYQVTFGVLSAFSFATRLGFIGKCMEECIYYLDFLLSGIFKGKPTVIGSVFKSRK